MIVAIFILIPLIAMTSLYFINKSGANKRSAIFFAFTNFLASAILIPVIKYKKHLILSVNFLKTNFLIDGLSTFMLFASATTIFVITLYSSRGVKKSIRKNRYFFIFFTLVLGINGILITTDFISLFIFQEVIILSAYYLFTTKKVVNEPLKSPLLSKLNFITSLIIVIGIILIYSNTNSLCFATLSEYFITSKNIGWTLFGLSIMFLGTLIKITLFPLFYRKTKKISSSQYSATAIFSGLLVHIVLYIFIRFYTIFQFYEYFLASIILLVFGLLFLFGGTAISALQNNFRKTFTTHIIGQVGFMLIALSLNTITALIALLFLILHNMFAKSNIFLIAGWINRHTGTLDIHSLSQVLKQSPLIGFNFFISAFSLAGIPPLGGFFGKYLLLKAGIEIDYIIITLIIIFSAILFLYVMIKIWLEVFWKVEPTSNIKLKLKKKDYWMIHSSTILTIAIIALGVFAQTVVKFAEPIAKQLLDVNLYLSFFR